jgi:hypothetical protein
MSGVSIPQPSKQMILIGSFGRNSGKTTLALELIRIWKNYFPVIAIKITSIDHKGSVCHRGDARCGACTGFEGKYVLEEEQGQTSVQCESQKSEKDTAKMLKAGARKVFWLRSFRTSLKEAFTVFLGKIPSGSLIICESNSLAKLIKPACFIMLAHSRDYPEKPSTEGLITEANLTLEGFYTKSDILAITSKIRIARTEERKPLILPPNECQRVNLT